MEKLSGIISDPSAILSTLQDNGHYVLDVVRSHPWTSLGVATGTVLLWSYIRAPRNLPPGPRGYPVVGAISCDPTAVFENFLEWRKKYGEVACYNRLGKTYVILNSERSIRDAFIKHGDVFANNNRQPDMATIGLTDEIFSSPYDEAWKRNKKFALTAAKSFGFGTPKSESRMQDQIQAFEEHLLKLNGSPVDLSVKLKLLCAAVINSILLGTSDTWQESGPAEISKLTELWDGVITDVFIALTGYQRYLPPTLARLLIGDLKMKVKEITNDVAGFVLSKMKIAAVDIAEREPENVIDAYLKERGTDPEVMHQIANTIIGFIPDAIQGTSILISWCLLHMTLNPDIQKQIYDEINRVCGSARVPSLSDKDKLPSIQALIHESLRHMLVYPHFSLQRMLHEDIQFYGYTLPKGAIIEANYYSVHYDPETFPEPEKFLITRFINDDGSFNITLGSKVIAFSMGPRKCVGEAFARQEIYLFLSRLVQRFELSFDPAAPTPTAQDKNFNAFFPTPKNFNLCLKQR